MKITLYAYVCETPRCGLKILNNTILKDGTSKDRIKEIDLNIRNIQINKEYNVLFIIL